MRFFLLLIGLSSTLAGCASSSVHHRGLAPDGYGFVENGPVLSPPEHLTPPHKATKS